MHRRAVTALVSAVVSSSILLAGCESRQSRQILEESQDISTKLDQIEQKIDANRLQPNDRVIILLKGAGIDSVQPMTKWVCKPAGADCDAQVRWILAGRIQEGWKVHVEEKKSAAPSNCFNAFDLDHGNRQNVQSPATSCQVTGMIWEYDVILRDQAGAERSRIDPLVPVSWSTGP
jgi:outer membrane murein-binding lipoprotein Lpp